MKKILICLVVVVGLVAALFVTTPLKNITKMNPAALSAYTSMAVKVLETGDPAKGMIDRYEVKTEDSVDDLVETIKSLAEEYNLRVVGDTKMYTREESEGKADEIYSVRNVSMCALSTAKEMLDYSMEYGGFMPCRVMIVEMGDGKKYLITMSLDLLVNGGFVLPERIGEIAEQMRVALSEIPRRAAIGDW